MRYKVTIRRKFESMCFYFSDSTEAMSFAIKAFQHSLSGTEVEVILEKEPVDMKELVFPLLDISGDEEV